MSDVDKAKLTAKFESKAIKSRKGAGNRNYEYLETSTIIYRLNEATANEWDYRITRLEWYGDLLIATGELTIPGLGTRSGTGVQRVAQGGGEDLVKGASSDCLKNCAKLFGVGLELYGEDYESSESAHAHAEAPIDLNRTRQRRAARDPMPDHEPTPAPAPNKGAQQANARPEDSNPLSQPDLRTLYEKCKKAGVTVDRFEQWARATFQTPPEHFTIGQGRAAWKWIKEQGDAELNNIPDLDDTPAQYEGPVAATPKQIKFLYALARENGMTDEALADDIIGLYDSAVDELSRHDASDYINRLQQRRDAAVNA